TNPANGPKPKSLTKNMARMISGKVRVSARMQRQTKYTGAGARLRAAPMPTGIEIKTPITVEATVIQMLSRMPSIIASERLLKSGGKNAEMKFAPRGKPSITRDQLIFIEPNARSRYTATPSHKARRIYGLLISGNGCQCRGDGDAPAT